MAEISFIVTNSGTITAVAKGKSYTVTRDHTNYDKIKEAIKNDDADTLIKLADIKKSVKIFTKDQVEIRDNAVFYEGQKLHNTLTDRIIQLMNEGLPFDPMIKFLKNLMQNPSFRAVNELYSFLENQRLPLTDDGCFLGYKRVRDNWTDFHSGTIDNSIGKVVEIARNKVDENPDHDCSNGLHVGSIEYVRDFYTGEGHVIIVKVNPRDAVSVPRHDTTKLRVCRYEVIGEYEGLLESPLYTSDGDSYPTSCSENDDDEEDYDDEEE
jgi:hypothetical protein